MSEDTSDTMTDDSADLLEMAGEPAAGRRGRPAATARGAGEVLGPGGRHGAHGQPRQVLRRARAQAQPAHPGRGRPERRYADPPPRHAGPPGLGRGVHDRAAERARGPRSRAQRPPARRRLHPDSGPARLRAGGRAPAAGGGRDRGRAAGPAPGRPAGAPFRRCGDLAGSGRADPHLGAEQARARDLRHPRRQP